MGNLSEPDQFEPNIEMLKSWREDHRVVLEEVISFTPMAWRTSVLIALAGDTDVNLRWAAVYLALNQKWVTELFGSASSARDAFAARFRARIVETARRAGSHYWIEREVIQAFLNAHEGRTSPLPRGNDRAFPSARELKLNCYLSDLKVVHPELEGRVTKLKARCKKVLLLLPPITWPSQRGAGKIPEKTNEGTPPLGLGQISSALAAAGHYVEIIDAHRYNYTVAEVSEKAKKFDYLGISMVFSTVQSTMELTKILARGNKRPKIVIGGHAFTLEPEKILSSNVVYDFLVFGPGELAFNRILDCDIEGKVPNEKNIVVETGSVDHMRGPLRKKVSAEYQSIWAELPLIERDAFRDPSNNSFEPARTRNGKGYEAHFVMSKGCDWSCNFCTEAVLSGPREVRRSASSVLDEVEYVFRYHDALHAQFIDDNVFPPIAAPGLKPAEVSARINWTEHFLEGLTKLRASTDGKVEAFSWRGLVRLEDILMYSARSPDFFKKLAESGCGLLAFGVEHGDAEVRKSLKLGSASVPTNSDICELIRNLHDVGIYTKAYFMLGGAHDSEELANKTIEFALNSGVDLAYFAIFKNFRTLRTQGRTVPDESLRFSQFAFNLEEMILTPAGDAWENNFGKSLRLTPKEYQSTLEQLNIMGFDFSNLFKYSDYHDDDKFDNIYFSDRDLYFRLLRKAYLEFYARKEWVETYAGLIQRGY